MLNLIFAWLFGMTIFAVGIWALVKKEHLGWLFLFAGFFIVAVATFFGAPHELPTGLPRSGSALSPGEYKVAFVHITEENVKVLIEKKEKEKECFFLYQFPRVAFDEPININSKKLLIVKANSFKKPVLK